MFHVNCVILFIYSFSIQVFHSILAAKLTPSLVTCHKEVEHGFLVNENVNEPENFKEDFVSKKTSKINMVTQYYTYVFVPFYTNFGRLMTSDSSPERQKEIDTCLEKNILCNQIESIHLLLESEKDIPHEIIKNTYEHIRVLFRCNSRDSNKVVVAILGNRWKYKDAFIYCNEKLSGEISIIANGDIYFDQSLIHLHMSSMRGKFLAITRYAIDSFIRLSHD